MNATSGASEKILLDEAGEIATITLNRPEKLNALDAEMLEQLEHVVRVIEQSPTVRVVLLTGAGERAFCVGADIYAWSALSPMQMWADWVRAGHRVFDQIARLRQPVIAVLNGYTLGGGLELALTADIRLAADGVELAQPEVKLGTVPGWGGTQRLPRAIGVARAKQMIFSGARISASTAERWGLINEVVPRAELVARARTMAMEIAGNAPFAVQIAKQIIDSSADSGAMAGSTLESLASATSAFTPDGQEGTAAFREKRPPQFTGSFGEDRKE